MLMQQIRRVLLDELKPQVCDFRAVIEEARQALGRMVIDGPTD